MHRVIVYAVLIIMVLSCETTPIQFNGPNFVRFTETALAEKESVTDIIKIQVHNVGAPLDENVTVFYSISGDAREGIDYEILGTRGSVTIEAGEYFGYIDVRLINNANNILRSQDLILTLTGSSSAGMGVGQSEGGIGKQFTFTIIDDCILGGRYTGKRGSATVNNIQITSSDCENYRVSNWDISLFGIASDPVPLNFIDNGDNTITVPNQDIEVIVFGIYLVVIDVTGLGTVDPITREIILSLEYEFLGDPFSPTLTFIPS